MKSCKVVALVGERVRLALAGDIEAIVTAITIRDEGVAYELTWMSGAEVQTAWMPASGITTGYELNKRIGFKKTF